MHNKRCNAKPPDVKSQIIRPGFATAFISLPNLALLPGFKLYSFIPKRRGGEDGHLRATTHDLWFVLAFAPVTASRVSCGNFLQKASPSVDSGLVGADDYKK